jgi:cytochrome c peroxidase
MGALQTREIAMPYRHRMAVLAVVLVTAGCERAHRFPIAPPLPSSEARPPTAEKEKTVVKVPANYGWMEARQQPLDIPLQFVTESSSEWKELKELWNAKPPQVGVIGPVDPAAPLEAAVAGAALTYNESIKIKVPRGLPDPNAFIPAANPPTLGKWALGKRLFFDKSLLVLSTIGPSRSCAECHDPATGYTIPTDKPASGRWNVPSLINSVYSRHQFWDGRAVHLEEVLERQLDNQDLPIEDPPSANSPGYLHVFPGLVGRLRGKEHYLETFKAVFGTDPTVDSIAKALATYMRTLLSGDSVYDQAETNKRKRQGVGLEPEDIEPALSDAALKQLPTALSAKDAAKAIARGYALFHGRAGCYECHSGQLFTDNSFHNIGIGESKGPAEFGKQVGRFATVPYGLKDRKLIGAFKTPTLRNLELTKPYMHDGSMKELADVVAYYDAELTADLNDNLDAKLLRPREGDRPVEAIRLGLGPADRAAVELFLRSLRGNDLPPILTAPPP